MGLAIEEGSLLAVSLRGHREIFVDEEFGREGRTLSLGISDREDRNNPF
jgi:hypothetical protein